MIRFISVWLLLILSPLQAQLNPPRISPSAELVQTIGLTQISIQYSRPAAKGRHLFGPDTLGVQGLVPYGRIWRMGANESTKITLDKPIEILGNLLPQGSYAIYAFPENDFWKIAFHNNLNHWGDGRRGYKSEEDEFRIQIRPENVLQYKENFEFTFENLTHSKADLVFQWGNLQGRIPINTYTEIEMENKIVQLLMAEPNEQDYYEIARYYLEQRIMLDTALVYLDKALSLGGDTYYFYRVRAKVLEAMGNYTEAITAAQKSIELAQKQDKDEFVLMNQKDIAAWKSKI